LFTPSATADIRETVSDNRLVSRYEGDKAPAIGRRTSPPA
jgi:hypothetical protein